MRLPENFDRKNPRYWNRLYRQNKDGSFTDVTEKAGLANAGDGNYGMGVAVGDYDNDGFPDLYVTSYGKNVLYHNNGDGTFTDVTAKAGVAAGGWSVSAGFFDYDNDGKLDLFVTRYMEWDTQAQQDLRRRVAHLLSARRISRHHQHSLSQQRRRHVSPMSARSRELRRRKAGRWAWPSRITMTTASLIYSSPTTACSSTSTTTTGDGTFTERALEAGAALSEDGRRLSGMGVVFQDYDNDGRPDVIVTELPREIYGVYHNEGNGTFSYGSLETGLGVLSSGSSGWGVGLEDFGNDGWKDLFVAQGHVLDNVEQIDPSLHYWELPLLAMNHNGRFERADSGSRLQPRAGEPPSAT